MQLTHAAVLNTLVRVQRFLDTNDASLGTVNKSGYRESLDSAVTALSAHAVNQTASKRSGAAETAKERVLGNALKLNNMRPIATVAAAQLRQVPDFVAFKMPPTNSTSRQLIAWAGSMGAAASAYTTVFTSAGLPSDFIAELEAAAAALADCLANRGLSSSQQSGATAGLGQQSTLGRQAVKVLNSLVEPKLAGNLSLLAAWNTAKRFGGRSAPVANTTVDAAAKGPSPAVLAAPASPSVSIPAEPATEVAHAS